MFDDVFNAKQEGEKSFFEKLMDVIQAQYHEVNHFEILSYSAIRKSDGKVVFEEKIGNDLSIINK